MRADAWGEDPPPLWGSPTEQCSAGSNMIINTLCKHNNIRCVRFLVLVVPFSSPEAACATPARAFHEGHGLLLTLLLCRPARILPTGGVRVRAAAAPAAAAAAATGRHCAGGAQHTLPGEAARLALKAQVLLQLLQP